ncbi:MAG TPA: alpha/beta fold hydrolase [candidate division Zixibacteria bacterium]|nr:alpha/beta fold hydrolase [candidate division Zixibacteria bacterium]
MPYELPEQRRAARSAALRRWLSFAPIALLVATLTYLAYVGFVGSAQVVDPPLPSRDCRTPESAFGGAYEAINYDQATDGVLAAYPDAADCPSQGAQAGSELVTADGVSIAGWYVPAASGIGPEGPTVVLAHGHGANKSTLLRQAEVLHDAYNVVLFDFRNHGQSEAAPTTVGVRERADLGAVLDWLEATKGPPAVAVWGISMGGAVAVNTAVSDDRIDALILESTHATLANALDARLARAGYPLSVPGAWAILLGGLLRTGADMSAADPVQAIERYDGPVLIIAGGADGSMGPNDPHDLLAAAQDGGSQAELQLCPAAGHGQSASACPDDYRDWVLGFLARTLTEAAASDG